MYWSAALHSVCGPSHSKDLGVAGSPQLSLTLAPNSLLLWTLYSLSLHHGPSGIRGSMGPGFVVLHTPRTWGLLVLTHSHSLWLPIYCCSGLSTLSLFTLAPLELGAPWARGLWSLWIWDIPRTWGLPVPPNSLSLCCTECHYDTQGGRASIQMVVLMTESGPTPHYSRGTGYHAFRGPRPVAWGQRSFSDADWECSNSYSYHFYQKDIMGLLPSPAIFHMHCTRKLTSVKTLASPVGQVRWLVQLS